ncbi:class I SAM-dependent methyltransferase [Desulfuribacillus stibiiarsenatis]|nr:class I SAM-dependent methyltransferase [Desulfuribacillus stibiiarsenatis]
MRPVKNKTYDDIASEWDEFAQIRSRQIVEGIDLSYHNVLIPCIFNLASKSDLSNVLDMGCGAGYLTYKLSKKAKKVIGVDLSRDNISIAQQNYGSNKKIDFIHSSIEDYADIAEKPEFSLAIANMTLMDVIKLDDVLSSVSKLLKKEGQFIFTITHPCFWPFYWKYADEEWFEYTKEIIIEAMFSISLQDTSEHLTTHVHRPLEMYFNSIERNGLKIDRIIEPLPTDEIANKYPKKWEYPRFLAVRCKKV